jgi:hypothetical protein
MLHDILINTVPLTKIPLPYHMAALRFTGLVAKMVKRV